jgi:hypothetical protein
MVEVHGDAPELAEMLRDMYSDWRIQDFSKAGVKVPGSWPLYMKKQEHLKGVREKNEQAARSDHEQD